MNSQTNPALLTASQLVRDMSEPMKREVLQLLVRDFGVANSPEVVRYRLIVDSLPPALRESFFRPEPETLDPNAVLSETERAKSWSEVPPQSR